MLCIMSLILVFLFLFIFFYRNHTPIYQVLPRDLLIKHTSMLILVCIMYVSFVFLQVLIIARINQVYYWQLSIRAIGVNYHQKSNFSQQCKTSEALSLLKEKDLSDAGFSHFASNHFQTHCMPMPCELTGHRYLHLIIPPKLCLSQHQP